MRRRCSATIQASKQVDRKAVASPDRRRPSARSGRAGEWRRAQEAWGLCVKVGALVDDTWEVEPLTCLRAHRLERREGHAAEAPAVRVRERAGEGRGERGGAEAEEVEEGDVVLWC